MVDLPRLQATLGGADLAWLVARVRRRLEQGDGLEGAVRLATPSTAERSAVARLFGRAPSRGPMAPSAPLTVRLAELDALLRHATLCDGIADAIEALTGPLVDRRAERAHTEAQWARLFSGAEERIDARVALRAWLDDVRASGLLRRLSGGDPGVAHALLHAACDVTARLPASGLPLAELAATAAGDSHALDAGAPLGTLTVRAAAALGGIRRWNDAEGRRDAWASVGVLCDELSAPVLTMNLRASQDTLTGRALCLHAGGGEPYRLTLRQLLRDPPAFTEVAGSTVFVCENPTVVAAVANRLGARSAPLVCLEGPPRTASRLLLGLLSGAGVRLVYHGDFDWNGLRFANLMIRRHGASPWRLSAEAYRAAVAAHGGRALRGRPAVACWDASLTEAMTECGRAVHEELVLDELVHDLAAARSH